jgi:light-regulated signal transduction histidine kinase (bacteriophytochrome)
MMTPGPEIKTDQQKFSDFIEAAAHDLHAPLRKLSVLIDRVFLKHADQFDEDAKEYIKRIEGCVEEMQSLIDGLTELTMAGETTATLTSCDLNAIVKDVMGTMNGQAEQEKVRFQAGAMPIVQGNTIQYRQLFKNLLENAIKFRREHSSLEIDLRTEEITSDERNVFHLQPGKKYYKIGICDNAIGFNNGFAEKIFEPFVRLHSKSKYPGNGLGLSICKKIVANHHGIIYAEGNEQTGSRFILILPETP